MREHRVTLPELALISGTRGLIGFGLGLLVSDRLVSDRRRVLGIALVAAGALSTIPLAIRVFRRRGNAHADDRRWRERAELMAD